MIAKVNTDQTYIAVFENKNVVRKNPAREHSVPLPPFLFPLGFIGLKTILQTKYQNSVFIFKLFIFK